MKLLFFLFLFTNISAQNIYFPPTNSEAWERISASELKYDTTKINGLYDFLSSNNSKAFILLKNGKIVFEKYFGNFTQDSPWYWASAGKTLTSFLIGIAQQEKFLSIDDKTSKYLGVGWTNCTQAQEDKIKIFHQLTMTTGLDENIFECTNDTCLNFKSVAGTRWAYHNSPYTLLDNIIANATGEKMQNYFYKKITLSTGISGLFVKSDFNNILYSNARSFARFGLLLLNKGIWDGNKILTDSNYFFEMTNSSQQLNKSYGYLTWLNGKDNFMTPGLQTQFVGSLIPNAPKDAFFALGKNGQLINVVPSENLVWIRFGEAPNSGDGGVAINLAKDIWDKINPIIKTNNKIKKQNENKFSISIYPNPVKNNFKINYPHQNYNLKIYDVLGKLVFEKNNCLNETDLDLTQIKNGIYFAKIYFGNKILATNKIMVIK